MARLLLIGWAHRFAADLRSNTSTRHPADKVGFRSLQFAAKYYF